MTKLGILLVQHLGVQRLRFVLAIFLLVFTGGGRYSMDAFISQWRCGSGSKQANPVTD